MRDRITRLEKIVASVASTGGTGLDALVSLVDDLREKATFLDGLSQGHATRADAAEKKLAELTLRIQALTSCQADTMTAVEDRLLAQADEIDNRFITRQAMLEQMMERLEAVEKLTPWEREGISHGQWLENKRKEKVAKAAEAAK
jgi:uncharacterized protein YaiL (DUF2058 family)